MATHGHVPARLVRSFLTFFLYGGGTLLCLVVLGMISVAVFASGDHPGDVSVRVAVGDRAFAPIVRLSSESPAALSPPALIGGSAELRFESNDRSLTLINVVGVSLGAIVVLYVVWMLRCMVDRVLEGRPFDAANIRAFHVLALLSVAVAVFYQAFEYLAARYVLSTVHVEGIALSPPFDLDLQPFLAALLLEVLASVFRHGAELEAERSLTI